jgi:hypothetical protein
MDGLPGEKSLIVYVIIHMDLEASREVFVPLEQGLGIRD